MANTRDQIQLEEKTTGTNTAPIFVQNANDLVRRLVPYGSDPTGGSLLHEARQLVANFERWAQERPSNQARIAGIQELMSLNRRAMDYLTNGVPNASPAAEQQPARRREPSFVSRLANAFKRGGRKR